MKKSSTYLHRIRLQFQVCLLAVIILLLFNIQTLQKQTGRDAFYIHPIHYVHFLLLILLHLSINKQTKILKDKSNIFLYFCLIFSFELFIHLIFDWNKMQPSIVLSHFFVLKFLGSHIFLLKQRIRFFLITYVFFFTQDIFPY